VPRRIKTDHASTTPRVLARDLDQTCRNPRRSDDVANVREEQAFEKPHGSCRGCALADIASVA
jgi:hypothetical protein